MCVYLHFLKLGLTSLSTHFRTVPACNKGYDNHFIVQCTPRDPRWVLPVVIIGEVFACTSIKHITEWHNVLIILYYYTFASAYLIIINYNHASNKLVPFCPSFRSLPTFSICYKIKWIQYSYMISLRNWSLFLICPVV